MAEQLRPMLIRWVALPAAALVLGGRALARWRARRVGLLERYAARSRVDRGYVPRWLFVRMLGVVYTAAFLSALVQIRGLAGERGIVPARQYLRHLRRVTGRSLSVAPTLLWLDASDRGLRRLCIAGALLPALLFFDLAPTAVLAALWALYLSIVSACQPFLRYQWDALLLETGLLASLYAPFGLRPTLRRQAPPSRMAVWLLRWLQFRVMFSSGVAKLVSRDPTWRGATALRYHYFTQPLPTWTSYYVHALPPWFHRLSVYGVWLAEVVMPPLGLGPRRLRALAAASSVTLQGLIAATGNYGFFNLLTAVLAIPLLDDRQLGARRLVRRAPRGSWWAMAAAPIGLGLVALSAIPLAGALDVDVRWPSWLLRAYRRFQPLQVANPYGLFAVMTTRRPELVVEGSRDGRSWRPYELEWKPGDPRRRPRFAPLHLPRLDWQMWFAALHPSAEMEWLESFLVRLLEGSPDVLALLHESPFPDRPPTYVRVRVFSYEFAPWREHRRDGVWWRREPVYELVSAARLEGPGEVLGP